jgi:hypothetical protein
MMAYDSQQMNDVQKDLRQQSEAYFADAAAKARSATKLRRPSSQHKRGGEILRALQQALKYSYAARQP